MMLPLSGVPAMRPPAWASGSSCDAAAAASAAGLSTAGLQDSSRLLQDCVHAPHAFSAAMLHSAAGAEKPTALDVPAAPVFNTSTGALGSSSAAASVVKASTGGILQAMPQHSPLAAQHHDEGGGIAEVPVGSTAVLHCADSADKLAALSSPAAAGLSSGAGIFAPPGLPGVPAAGASGSSCAAGACTSTASTQHSKEPPQAGTQAGLVSTKTAKLRCRATVKPARLGSPAVSGLNTQHISAGMHEHPEADLPGSGMVPPAGASGSSSTTAAAASAGGASTAGLQHQGGGQAELGPPAAGHPLGSDGTGPHRQQSCAGAPSSAPLAPGSSAGAVSAPAPAAGRTAAGRRRMQQERCSHPC
jgi:hypothetical protein